MDSNEVVFKPPYIAFQTFWGFVENLATQPLPPQIDRSMMSNKSGSDQNNLLLTLRSFRLIDEDSNVMPGLVQLAGAQPDRRKELLGDLVLLYYRPALAVSEANGTEKQLNDSFREHFGLEAPETRRKAIAFFLHAARTSEISLSSYFPKTRPGSGAPGAPRLARRTVRKKVVPPGTPTGTPPDTSPPAAERPATSVTLGNGGTVTLSANVNPLTLRGQDRIFFYKIVDAFEEFADSHSVAPDGEPAEVEEVSTS